MPRAEVEVVQHVRRVERANGAIRVRQSVLAQLQDTVGEALGVVVDVDPPREGPGTTAHVQAKLARRTQEALPQDRQAPSVHHAAVEVVGAQPKD